jgi:hypothetical protein
VLGRRHNLGWPRIFVHPTLHVLDTPLFEGVFAVLSDDVAAIARGFLAGDLGWDQRAGGFARPDRPTMLPLGFQRRRWGWYAPRWLAHREIEEILPAYPRAFCHLDQRFNDFLVSRIPGVRDQPLNRV